MVTEAQSAYNLRTAVRNVSTRLGVDPQALNYEQRIAYNAALAAEILRFPNSFLPRVVSVASIVAAKEYAPLEDPGSAWQEFAPAVVDTALGAGSSAAGVGNGILATLSAAKWIIPAAAVAVVVILLAQFAKQKTA